MQMASHRVIQKLTVSNMTSRPLRFRGKFEGHVDVKFGSGWLASWTLNGPNAGFDVPAGPGTFPIYYEVDEFGNRQFGDYECSVTDVEVTYLQ